ncbi:MAG: FKBP-type peptidyl-prolyl cis-trans isomerase [Acidimicrobiia bacterium]
MRRLGIILAIVATALVGTGAVASPATVPLTKVTVNGASDEKPTLKFAKPFAATATTHRVVAAGSGDKLAKGAKITFDYVVVDGRTGKELGTSFGATPVATVLDTQQTAAGLVKSLVGSSVGSRVLIAIAPKEGLAANAKTNGAKNVKKNDTLLFLVDVKSVRTPLERAAGDAVAPAEGLPAVALDATTGKPSITVPGADAPSQLVVQPLIKGTGATVDKGQSISVHYTGVIWGSGKQFDSSWDRGKPADFTIGTGNVILGWDAGLVGQTVGSQVLLVVPPDQGYGSGGKAQAGIAGTDTLVFVVDILDAY